MKNFHLHLVSDATGETNNAVARACFVQFEDVEPIEHNWLMIRTERQLEKVIAGIKANPGVVLFTILDKDLRKRLEAACRELSTPYISVLDPILDVLANYLQSKARNLPGRQHALDAEYFARIEAMDFVMQHDDGQALVDLSKADVVLVGVSRTSKSPTCIYLGNRGIKAANVPLVPGLPLPEHLEELEGPLIVGLTNDPNVLVQIRRNRLRMLNETRNTEYIDPEAVKAEIAAARRLFAERGWPVLDVSRRSIEETAAAIMQMVDERREKRAKASS